MVNYRRNFVPGGTFFFTATLADRSSRLLIERIEILRGAFREVRRQQPFAIVAIVVLPDHLHAIWRLPEGDYDYSGRWRGIKSRFTRGIKKGGLKLVANEKGEYKLWARRFWEHTIRDDEDLGRHVAYFHYNPVKHGYVEWPHSSFHRYVRLGELSSDGDRSR